MLFLTCCSEDDQPGAQRNHLSLSKGIQQEASARKGFRASVAPASIAFKGRKVAAKGCKTLQRVLLFAQACFQSAAKSADGRKKLQTPQRFFGFEEMRFKTQQSQQRVHFFKEAWNQPVHFLINAVCKNIHKRCEEACFRMLYRWSSVGFGLVQLFSCWFTVFAVGVV